MRMGFYALLLFALVPPQLSAFQGRLDAEVGNDSDSGVQLQLLSAKHSKPISKEEWGSVRFPDPEAPENGLIQIKTNNCTLQYDIMTAVGNYHWKVNGVIKFQLEKDLYLYAVPPDSKSILLPSELEAIQPAGFPVQPVKKECS